MIGLLAAMPSESAALLRLVESSKRSQLDGFRLDRFRVAGRDCALVTSGMGIRRAGQATRALLESFRPELLLSFGIAGAARPDLEIGDVVLGEQTCRLENGLPGRVASLASLSSAAREAIGQAILPYRASLLSGTAITTRGAQVGESQVAALPNPILEMETAGIAEAAMKAGIPLLVLRSISDGPRAPLPFDLETVLDRNDNIQAGKMIRVLLRHPEIILRSRQLLRNSRIAADRAAVTVMAVLDQPEALLSV
jgi:adenosylhomocysteine nucleosidase